MIISNHPPTNVPPTFPPTHIPYFLFKSTPADNSPPPFKLCVAAGVCVNDGRASDVGDVLLDVLLEFGGVGPVGSVDDLALHGDDDLGLAGGVEVGDGQGLYFLLI